jgi:hypothetical protein
LEDAIGRIAPVHLQFVTSWDAFNAVLEIRFRDLQGFKKVKDKQYGLRNKATKRDVEQTRPWQRAFLPGQRIEMSFFFDTQKEGINVDNVVCPGCQTPTTAPTDAEVQCENCTIYFQRITIIQEREIPSQKPVPSPWRSKSEFGKPGFSGMIFGPVRPGRKCMAPNDLDGDEDLREFKRIRLISRKEKVISQIFDYPQAFSGFSDLASVDQSESSRPPIPNLYESEQKPVPWENCTESDEDFEEMNDVEAEPDDSDEETRLCGKRKRASISPSSCKETENIETKLDDCDEETDYVEEADYDKEADDDVETYLYEKRNRYCFTLPLYRLNIPFSLRYQMKHGPFQVECFPSYRHLDPIPMGGCEWSLYRNQLGQNNNFLWPRRSMSLRSSWYIRAPGRIFRAESLYGTPFRVKLELGKAPKNYVFYGPSVGRWIFDWACQLSSKRPEIGAAFLFWCHMYTMEEVMAIFGLSRFPCWGMSEEATLHLAHAIVCYGCFRWQLFYMMNRHGALRNEPQIQHVVGEILAHAYEREVFTNKPRWLLEKCHRYLRLVMNELADIQATGLIEEGTGQA